METLDSLTNRHAQPGSLKWIGVRPGRRTPLEPLTSAEVMPEGIVGDHRTRPGKRAVTLVQAEHLAVIAALLGQNAVTPELLRRNLVVAGINLLGLRKRRFRVGGALLEGTGLCAPCSRMEEVLGPGGYSAVRGHGGITATVIEPGSIALGDAIEPI
ncbi:MAG: MOSC domain-containing protein [Pseudomonadota bacterium]